MLLSFVFLKLKRICSFFRSKRTPCSIKTNIWAVISSKNKSLSGQKLNLFILGHKNKFALQPPFFGVIGIGTFIKQLENIDDYIVQQITKAIKIEKDIVKHVIKQSRLLQLSLLIKLYCFGYQAVLISIKTFQSLSVKILNVSLIKLK